MMEKRAIRLFAEVAADLADALVGEKTSRSERSPIDFFIASMGMRMRR